MDIITDTIMGTTMDTLRDTPEDAMTPTMFIEDLMVIRVMEYQHEEKI